jgi:serine/threonine-protein kinase
MSEVYKGKQVQLDRWVAVKVLHPFLADDEGFVVRFRREARIVATLRHPNIVQVFDFDYHQDLDIYYMVMEYIDGPTLKSVIADQPLAPERAIQIGAAVADALDYAHARDMIHRDIKPANVMFIDDEQPVLTDFGIAKMLNLTGLTASGAMVGTPAYMAPEVGIGKPGTAQSDIYSLSVMIYQMLTNRLPFGSETPMGMVMQHINDAPPAPTSFEDSISPSLESVILKALEKDPEDRYPRAEMFASALRESVGLHSVTPSLKRSSPATVDEGAEAPAEGITQEVETKTPASSSGEVETHESEERDPLGELLTPSDELAQPRAGLWSWVGSGLAAVLILSVITFAVWLGIGGQVPASLAAVISNAANLDAPKATAVPTESPTPMPTQGPTPTPVATSVSDSSDDDPAVAVEVLPTATPRIVPTVTPTPVCNPIARVDKIWVVPDDTVPPETPIIAYVTLENSGSCAWPAGTEFVLASGEALGAPTAFAVGALASRDTIQVVLPMQAPEELGTYTSTWNVQRSDGSPLGSDALIEVIVEDLPPFTPTPVIESDVVTVTPAPLEVQPPELLDWTEDREQNLWSGTLKLQATGGTGEYRFYRGVIAEDNRVEEGIMRFQATRCQPLILEIWTLSGPETVHWQGEIAYPDPEACP